MCGSGTVTSASDNWVRRYHQWGSLVNWESTQVNSTGVPWAMYWGLYMIQGCAQTKLCYEWQLMANEEWVKGYQRRIAKEELIMIRTALHSCLGIGYDIIDKR